MELLIAAQSGDVDVDYVESSDEELCDQMQAH